MTIAVFGLLIMSFLRTLKKFFIIESDFSNVADAGLFKSLSVVDIFLRTLQKLKMWKIFF